MLGKKCNPMKKSLMLWIIAFFMSVPLYSQVIQYEISVKYNHFASGTVADITIKVNSGEPDFTYFLMTNDPFNGRVLEQSEPGNKKNYIFKDVKPGVYFVKITDKNGMPAGKTVEIKENETDQN
jgi:hypothetical protein